VCFARSCNVQAIQTVLVLMGRKPASKGLVPD
jgi:hypothetical protein